MSRDLRTLAFRWYREIYDQGRLETIDELMAPHAVIHGGGLDVRPIHGPSDLKEQVLTLREAFPDLRVAVEEVIAEDDFVVIRCVASGTHCGEALGIPPTGRVTKIPGMTMGRWTRGQLAEGWSHWDLLSFYRQLGVLSLFEVQPSR